VAGYRRLDIRREINIFNLGDKVKECQQNYLEHILRMPTEVLKTYFKNANRIT
jgi:hypothetical protein